MEPTDTKIISAEKSIQKLNKEKSDQEFDNQDAKNFQQLISTNNLNENNNSQSVTNANPSEFTLGEKILQGMQNITAHVEKGKANIENILTIPDGSEVMSMQQIFKSQYAINNLMVTEDYIGKIVSKSTQTFDTLLRNQ